MPPPTPLTLIVATTPIRTTPSPSSTHHQQQQQQPNPTQNATRRLGIGLNGTLPWPRIKTDMTFFARVTSRPSVPGTINAMIMGRKTYDSVPEKLRPLGKRVSVVVSRDEGGSIRERVKRELDGKRERVIAAAVAKGLPAPGPGGDGTDAIVSSSLENALRDLENGYGAQGKLGNVFVIGGGEIYTSALRGETDRKVRIVMTNVKKTTEGEEYVCDTFFPVEDLRPENGWRQASAEEVTEWVGESVTGEWRDEGEVSVQMVGYERID